MKKTVMILGIFFLSSAIFSQGFPPKHQGGPRERIEQLEKIKLLEVLNLDEETSIRFFSRRNDFKEEHKKIIDERDHILLEMEMNLRKGRSIEDYDYRESLERLNGVEKKIIDHREQFINSLSDIMTIEQISKYVVFESKFLREVRDALMRRKGVE